MDNVEKWCWQLSWFSGVNVCSQTFHYFTCFRHKGRHKWSWYWSPFEANACWMTHRFAAGCAFLHRRVSADLWSWKSSFMCPLCQRLRIWPSFVKKKKKSEILLHVSNLFQRVCWSVRNQIRQKKIIFCHWCDRTKAEAVQETPRWWSLRKQETKTV